MDKYLVTSFQNLRSGDLLFVNNQDNYIFNRLIQCFTRSRINHVGIFMIIDNKPHVLEALLETDSINLTPLEEFLNGYKHCKIYCRRSVVHRDLQYNRKMIQFYNMVINKKYYFNVVTFVKANCRTSNKLTKDKIIDTQEFFCSSLGLYFLQYLGFVDLSYDPRMFSPKEVYQLKDVRIRGPELIYAK